MLVAQAQDSGIVSINLGIDSVKIIIKLLVPVLILSFCSNINAGQNTKSIEDSFYDVSLGVTRTNIVGDKIYLSIALNLGNYSNSIVSYTITSAQLDCATSLGEVVDIRSNFIVPEWTRRGVTGILLAGGNLNLDSIGFSRSDEIGVIGPLDDSDKCTYKLVVDINAISSNDKKIVIGPTIRLTPKLEL